MALIGPLVLVILSAIINNPLGMSLTWIMFGPLFLVLSIAGIVIINKSSREGKREEREDKIADKKVELADLKLVENYAEDLRNLLSQSSLAEQKAFIRS